MLQLQISLLLNKLRNTDTLRIENQILQVLKNQLNIDKKTRRQTWTGETQRWGGGFL